MGGQHYFFPPNKDPIYHEVADTVIDWQDELYGPAIQAEFTRQHIQYFNDDLYDFFALVYGDTVPSVGFGANGMTFEKYNVAPIAERTYEHYVSQWVSLSTAALHRASVLSAWHQEYVEAYFEGVERPARAELRQRQGLAAPLPGADRPGSPLLPARRPGQAAGAAGAGPAAAAHGRRGLPADLAPHGPGLQAVRAFDRATTLPAGTYWIPMAQQQKHWIQAMLNEDTYVAFPYFYDISGWSNPLLVEPGGGRSGAFLGPSAKLVPPQSQPPPPVPPGPIPSIAVLRTSSSANARSRPAGWRTCSTRSGTCRTRRVTAGDIANGGLTGYDVLIATQGDPIVASNALGPAGRKALASWLNGGGRYLGCAEEPCSRGGSA